jgi:V/A-type H+-transporting ATPase subunit G/H
MQEIVNKVLEAEQEAEKTVQEARAQAAEIRRRADEESEASLQKAREQAQSLIQEGLAEARARAAREQEQARSEAESRSARYLEERREALEAATRAVVALLATPEHERGEAQGGLSGGAGT